MANAKTCRGIIFVLVGPGGAGKNAIMRAVIRKQPHIRQLATATTRAMRADERQGREHRFVSRERFQLMIAADELLEYQEVTPGKFYGIPRQTVDDCIRRGQLRIADIEPLGARELASAYPRHTVQIFVTVPGETRAEQLAVLKVRMRTRDDGGTDINERLRRAETLELPYRQFCDYVVVNGDLAGAINKTCAIIRRELRQRGHPEIAI